MGSPFVIANEKIEFFGHKKEEFFGEFYHYSGISNSYFINSIVFTSDLFIEKQMFYICLIKLRVQN